MWLVIWFDANINLTIKWIKFNAQVTNSCLVYLRSLWNARRSDMAICLCYWTFFFTHKVDFRSWVTPSNWTCWWRTLQWYQYQYKQCINIHTIKYWYRWSEVVFKIVVCFKTLYPGSTIGFSTPFKPTPQVPLNLTILMVISALCILCILSFLNLPPPTLLPGNKVAPPLPSSPVPWPSNKVNPEPIVDSLESANAEVKSETNKVKENLKVLLKLSYGHSKIADSSLSYKFADKIYAPHSLLILGKKEKWKGKTKQNKKNVIIL